MNIGDYLKAQYDKDLSIKTETKLVKETTQFVRKLIKTSSKHSYTLFELKKAYFRFYGRESTSHINKDILKKVCEEFKDDTYTISFESGIFIINKKSSIKNKQEIEEKQEVKIKEQTLIKDLEKPWFLTSCIKEVSALYNKISNNINVEQEKQNNPLYKVVESLVSVSSNSVFTVSELKSFCYNFYKDDVMKILTMENFVKAIFILNKVSKQKYVLSKNIVGFEKIIEKKTEIEKLNNVKEEKPEIVSEKTDLKQLLEHPVLIEWSEESIKEIEKLQRYYNNNPFDYEKARVSPDLKEFCDILEKLAKETKNNTVFYSQIIYEYLKKYDTLPSTITIQSFIKALITLTHTSSKKYSALVFPAGFCVSKKYKETKTTTPEMTPSETVQNDGSITLYVYSGLNNVICIRSEKHSTKCVTIETKNRKNRNISFNAFFCSFCKRYFTTVDVVENTFPTLNFPLIKLNLSALPQYSEKKDKSELALYGYNVRANGLSEHERRTLLSQLLSQKILTKQDIVSILRSNINYNGRQERLKAAVERWEDDIEFVQNFDLNKQQKVYSNKVDMVYKGKPLK